MALDNHVKALGVSLSPPDVAGRCGRTHEEEGGSGDVDLNDEDALDDEDPASGNARHAVRHPAGSTKGGEFAPSLAMRRREQSELLMGSARAAGV